MLSIFCCKLLLLLLLSTTTGGKKQTKSQIWNSLRMKCHSRIHTKKCAEQSPCSTVPQLLFPVCCISTGQQALGSTAIIWLVPTWHDAIKLLFYHKRNKVAIFPSFWPHSTASHKLRYSPKQSRYVSSLLLVTGRERPKQVFSLPALPIPLVILTTPLCCSFPTINGSCWARLSGETSVWLIDKTGKHDGCTHFVYRQQFF